MNFLIHLKELTENEPCRFEATLPCDVCNDANDVWSCYQSPIAVAADCLFNEDLLLVNLEIKTDVCAPCTICSETFSFPLHIKEVRLEFAIDPAEHKEKIDLVPHIREAVLLETPLYVECSRGHCPERATLAKYLSQPVGE